MSSLTPIPSDKSTCEHCGSPLVSDQRYCLSCGQPASPVRLAFLDVLQREGGGDIQTLSPAALPVAYDSGPPHDPVGPPWLRRYAPLFAVGSVLLLAMLIGLLVGHWVSQGKSNGPQVVRIEGLGSLSAGVAPATTESEATTKSSKGAVEAKGAPKEEKSSPVEEKKEQAEAREEEAKHVTTAKPVKVSKSQISKLDSTHGRKHEEEVNKLGDAPIEVP